MLQRGEIPHGGIAFAVVLKDPKSARNVSYDELLAVPKGYSMSFDRQDIFISSRCVVAPFIAAFKGITS